MPSLRGHGRKGNLYVRVIVKIPEKLNERQRELLQAFGETEGVSSRHKKKKSKNLWDIFTK